MNRNQTQPPLEHGQSLLEFAIGLVILFILLAGIVDVGRAMFTLMALREAAQEGAVYGAAVSTNTANIEARLVDTSDLLQSLRAGGSDAVVEVSTTFIGGACAGNGIKVRIVYQNFPLTMPFLGAVIGRQTVAMSAEATDTILRPPCP